MSFSARLEGADKAGAFLGKFKRQVANDLMRYMIKISAKYVAESRKYLTKKDGGYDTGTLSRSIAFNVSGDKFAQLKSEIGPLKAGVQSYGAGGMQVSQGRSVEFNYYVAQLIEGGFKMKPHFVPFHKYPNFDAWAARNRIPIPAKGGGLMIKGNSGKMQNGAFPGRKFMERGFQDGGKYADSEWQAMVNKWRGVMFNT